MNPEELAAQLKTPHGEHGISVGEKMNESNIHISKLTYELLELKSDEKVLEIGFGNGKFIPLLFEKAAIHYEGIDISEVMITEATKHNQKLIAEQKVKLQLASVSKIPFASDYFDKICTVNTLYFWPDPLHNAKEIVRVLKPGGIAIIGIRLKDDVKDAPFTKYGFTLYSEEEAIALFQKAGFSKVRTVIQKDPEITFDGKKYQIHSLCVIGVK